MPIEHLEQEIEEQVPNPDIKNTVLDDDNILPLILKLSFPIMIGSLIDALYNTIDSIFVGRFVGRDALAALTINNTIQITLMAIGATLSVGTGVVISQALGAKKYKIVNEALLNGLVAAFFCTIIWSWSMLFNLDNILLFIGSAQSFLVHTRDYASIILWVSFVPVMNGVMSAVLRAKGYANLSMWVLAIGAVMNIILDSLFIVVFGWGVKGAALATVFSQMIVSVFSFVFIVQKYQFHFKDFFRNRINFPLMGEICLIGLAPGVRLATFTLMSFIVNKTLQGYGVQALAAYGIVNRIVNLAFMPIFGCNLGSQPVIAFNYGARRFDRIMEATKVSIAIVTLIGAFATALFLWSPHWLFSLFTSDVGTVDQSIEAMRIMGVFFVIFGMQMVIAGFTQSTGFVRLSLFLALSRPLMNIIGFLIFPPVFGLQGVWYTYPFADIVNSIFALAVLYWIKPRLKKELMS